MSRASEDSPRRDAARDEGGRESAPRAERESSGPGPGAEADESRPRGESSGPGPGAEADESRPRGESSGGDGPGGAPAPSSGGGPPPGGGPVEVAIVSVGVLSMWRRLGWALGVLGLLAAVIWLAILLPIVSVPLLLAVITAYLLTPLVDRLQRWRIRRTLGIAIIVLGFMGAMAGLVAIAVPLLADEVRRMPDQLADLFQNASAWVEGTFDVAVPQTGDEIVQAASSWFGQLEGRRSWLSSGAQVVFGRTASAVGMLLGFLMIPIFAFFLLRDFPSFTAKLRELVPPHYRPVVARRVSEIDSALGGFIRGQLIVSAILAVLYSIGLWAVGLPLAVAVGVISGLGNMVPYLGTTIGILLATAVALLDWQGIVQLLLVYGVFAVVQALEGWLITPNIVANRVGLSPFGVIVAVLAFGELFGFLGILLAVPIAAILKIFLSAAVESYRHSGLYMRTPPT